MRAVTATVLTAVLVSAGAGAIAPGATAAPAAAPTARAAATATVTGAGAVDPTNPEVDPLSAGTATRPTRDVTALKRRQAAARPTLRTGALAQGLAPSTVPTITGYTLSGTAMKPVAHGERPFEKPTVTPVRYGTLDATGVRMFTRAGDPTVWNHPVGQAQYAIHSLNGYRVTGNPEYLDVAKKNAQRLVDRRVVSGGAWYYPYDFDFAVHGDTTETLKAPWYSGMAQGQALNAFVRLFEVTGDAAWRVAADATFASLLQQPVGTAPFAVHVDAGRRLWLEEYPRYPAANSEKVLNGHIFAMFGLHDYWQLTGSAEAAQLFKGALWTVEQTVPTEFRRPEWLSVYSLRHKVNTRSYHKVHIEQFTQLWTLTHDPRWIRHATTFRNDFPSPGVAGTLQIMAGTTTLFKVSTEGAVTATRRIIFARSTGAPFDRHERIRQGPVAYRISAGALTGWSIAEGPSTAWALGAIDSHAFNPSARMLITGGVVFTAYRLDAQGKVAEARAVRLALGRTLSGTVSFTAFVRGRPAAKVASGTLAGYWVPLQSQVVLGS